DEAAGSLSPPAGGAWHTLAVSVQGVAAPANVADTVRLAAQRDPAGPALISGPLLGAPVISWGELDARVDAVAASLRGLNLPSSMGVPARVAIALPQVPEFAVIFFGVLRAGLVAVPLNPG